MRGQMSGWFQLRDIREDGIPVMRAGGDSSVFSDKWDAAPVALIVLAGIVALGSLFAIFAMCYFWSRYVEERTTVETGEGRPYWPFYCRYKASRTVVTDRSLALYGALPKYNALLLPPSEKEYETQVCLSPPVENVSCDDWTCFSDVGVASCRGRSWRRPRQPWTGAGCRLHGRRRNIQYTTRRSAGSLQRVSLSLANSACLQILILTKQINQTDDSNRMLSDLIFTHCKLRASVPYCMQFLCISDGRPSQK